MSKQLFDFDNQFSFEQRKQAYSDAIEKYPGKIPIIIQKSKSSKLTYNAKIQLYVAKELTIGGLMNELRKRIDKIQPEQALFLFINNSIPPSNSTLETVYNKHKSDDGFLKIMITEENTFG